ncbi:hypothetical protein AWZ03_005142 [Drosophila navojoa]|uniref:J domain-containing protein n=1 Tax=Drosophila navojoa TaxID=7232 RepID=A0A484BI07_DRONA|nr:uncharacterized protein LOC108659494 [Drosophila navojoa]TDG48397.1 hypothetical protein AWZ03_005142 [Drosophila navojoa]
MLKYVQSNVFIPVRFMASFHTIYAHNVQGSSRSYYEVLKVPLNSSGKEIKQAFFELSKKYHPDANSDSHDSDEFVKVCEAYRILYKRVSREHHNNRLRLRYRTMAPLDICYTNKNVHKNWTKYQAAIRQKQFGHEINSVGAPIVLCKCPRIGRPSEVRLLPARNRLPVVRPVEASAVLGLPPPFAQSQESWLPGYYVAAFGVIVALIVVDSVQRAGETGDPSDHTVASRQRSFKYFSGLLPLITQT